MPVFLEENLVAEVDLAEMAAHQMGMKQQLEGEVDMVVMVDLPLVNF